MQRYKLVQEMVNNGFTADWQTVAKPDPNGSWCLHSDVEVLDGEKKEFQSKADAYQSVVNQRNELVEKLESQIEKLNDLVLEQETHFHQTIENLKELGVDSSLIMKAMTRPPQWSKEWPTEEGWYWAYGDFSQRGIDKQLQFVEVVDFLGLLYSCSGKILNPGLDLAWTPAILPDTAGAVALLEGDES